MVDFGACIGARGESTHGPASACRTGIGWPRAFNRAGTRAPLVVALADRFHDDLVTPRRVAIRIKWPPRRRYKASHQETQMTRSTEKAKPKAAKTHAAEIVREYGPFAGFERIHGVTHDGV